MKNSNRQKLVSIILTAGLLLTMSACGNSKETTNQSNASTIEATSTVTSTENSTTEQAAADPLGKYDPEITITSVRSDHAAYKYPDGEDISNNVWTREMQNTLGIKVQYNWVSAAGDSQAFSNKLNVSIASGDLPDFFVSDARVYSNLAKNNLIADLTEVYDKYASPELKALMDSFPEGFESGKTDGKLMGLSTQGFGLMGNMPVVWIRDDWMKKVGLSAPKSMDDLTKMAETFMKNNSGTYGLGITKDLYSDLESIQGIANAHHAYPKIWVKDSSGQIVYGSIQPEMKNALKTMQDWYAKGIISKEFAVKDTNKVNEDIVSGKVGIEFGASWNCHWPIPDLVKKDINAIFKPYAIPSVDGEATKLWASWPVGGYYVASKNCKNPEAIIKMANLAVKKMYNGTAEDFKTLVDSEAQNLCPITMLNPSQDYNRVTNICDALNTKDPSKLAPDQTVIYENILKWVNDKNPDNYGVAHQLGVDGSLSILKNFVDQKQYVMDEMRGASPEAFSKVASTLEKIEKDAFTKIIMGASIDDFDKFVSDWKSLGGDEATKAVNEAFNK